MRGKRHPGWNLNQQNLFGQWGLFLDEATMFERVLLRWGPNLGRKCTYPLIKSQSICILPFGTHHDSWAGRMVKVMKYLSRMANTVGKVHIALCLPVTGHNFVCESASKVLCRGCINAVCLWCNLGDGTSPGFPEDAHRDSKAPWLGIARSAMALNVLWTALKASMPLDDELGWLKAHSWRKTLNEKSAYRRLSGSTAVPFWILHLPPTHQVYVKKKWHEWHAASTRVKLWIGWKSMCMRILPKQTLAPVAVRPARPGTAKKGRRVKPSKAHGGLSDPLCWPWKLVNR